MPKNLIKTKLEFIFCAEDCMGTVIWMEEKLNHVDFSSGLLQI